jgi:Flp pilus assembly protein TadB
MFAPTPKQNTKNKPMPFFADDDNKEGFITHDVFEFYMLFFTCLAILVVARHYIRHSIWPTWLFGLALIASAIIWVARYLRRDAERQEKAARDPARVEREKYARAMRGE